MKIGDDFETYLRILNGRASHCTCFPGVKEGGDAMGFITISACHAQKAFTWHGDGQKFVLTHINDSLDLADEIEDELAEMEGPKPS